jgi:hypothetical protein
MDGDDSLVAVILFALVGVPGPALKRVVALVQWKLAQ